MPSISRAEAISNPDLTGVTIFPMSGPARRGEPQDVLVCVEPGATIPLHTHEVDARMLVVAGSAEILSDNPSSNGTMVGVGTSIFWEAFGPHGFLAGPKGLTFLSHNGGIVDENGNWDIAFA